MIVQKRKPQTDKELTHTDIYFDGTYIGYIIVNISMYAAKNENWNFVSKHHKLKHTYDKTKKALIDKLDKLCREAKL